ncbi:MAG: hypothetical protein MRY49_02405 [Candidatus Pacebacteria bacterium]|nr:hypothetical protein [Candidatus Paceibacterota bacterium]
MKFLSILLFFVAIPAFAQSSSNVYLYLSPQNPEPNTPMTATLQSYSMDLETSNIRWLIGGVEEKSGLGETSFDFSTEEAGSNTLLSAVITTSKGERVEKNLTIRPASVDILWYSTNSTVPMFYKGKALRTRYSSTVLVAMPNIFGENPNNPDRFRYSWYYNGSSIPSTTGVGANTFNIGPAISSGNPIVRVVVETVDGRYSAESSISLETTSPEVLLYEKDPLLGVLYNKTLPDLFSLEKEEITISATPYFFRSNNLEYVWEVDGEKLEDNISDRDVIFRRDIEGDGSSSISILVSSIETVLQKIQTDLIINY